MADLESRTRRFFLGSVADTLREEIDWRARGGGQSAVTKLAVYLAAFARDLLRIPLHHKHGIGQARFRARVAYITGTALPTIQFFLDNHELDSDLRSDLVTASERLRGAEPLLADGSSQALDEWYATMEEFGALQAICADTVSLLDRAIGRQDDSEAHRPEV